MALVLAPLAALISLGYGVYLARGVLSQPDGTPEMQRIATAIEKGAMAYLKRQFVTILPFSVLLFIVVYLALGLGSAVAFVLGAVSSAIAGFVGMYVAVKGNVRTAYAARKGLNPALSTAFKSGAVNGLFLVGLGLLGVSIIYASSYYLHAAQGDAAIVKGTTEVLTGFGFGAALLALFMRVGGGIFTKAADVGADLVGKVEQNIPEDDPRNPATIADNVGDNVGDCAGMGADVFESYSVTFVAAMLLGGAVFGLQGLLFPLFVRAAAVLADIAGTFFVKAKNNRENPFKALERGYNMSNMVAAALLLVVSYFVFGTLNAFVAVLVGLVGTKLISIATEYYTGLNKPPVLDIAKSSKMGAGPTVIWGVAVGMESTFSIVLIVAAAALSGYYVMNDPLVPFSGFYGIALASLGMLGATGFLMSMDTYGPISDNAQGIGEMSKSPKSATRVLGSLDAVGNTTKALTKGFAIGSAALAGLALYATYFEKSKLAAVDISIPVVFVGLLLGAALPWLFSSFLMRAVGRAAMQMVEEVRRQFKTMPILQGKAQPDYARCVDISTKAALSELVIPAAMVVLAPLLVFFGVGLVAPVSVAAEVLAAFLGGTIVSALLLAVFSCNSGGAMDNAKKYIEDGHFGGKGSPAHAAAVVGDTLGDPLKDTSGPALNPMIKIVNIVSLLIVSAVIAGSLTGL